MLSWMTGWGRALMKGARRKPGKNRRDHSRDLYPTLQVRMLEERRVFHAGAIVAPTETATPEPPPPTTTVTLDAGQNLLVQDSSADGQNDQLSVRLDAANGRYEIYDPGQLLQTDIAGAEGNGTNRLYIPVEVVTGDKLIFQTGAGDDSLAVDLSGGLGGKSLVFDGGAGENDSLTISGGSYSAVGYVFMGDGSTQIQAGNSALQLTGVEPIFDYLAADTRQFTIGAGVSGLALGDDGIAANGLSRLETSLGTSVTFASPWHSLTLGAEDSAGQPSLAVSGLDNNFAADLTIDAGDSGRVELSGQIHLHGSDLRASGDTIQVSGSIITGEATIDLSARRQLTVTAEGVLENSAGQVLLDAGGEGTLQFSGRIDASGLAAGQTGGTVHLLGWQVEVLGTASIDASGMSGGGTVLVGGDYQGANPLIRNATNTLVQSETSISANALENGNGGRIIVWADEAAVVAGSGNLQARGGASGGDGGFIETSGKQYLEVRDAADASSPFGNAGTWLLDPTNLTVVAGTGGSLPGGSFTSSPGNSTIGATTITNALQGGTNVTLNTGASGSEAGNITVNAPISVAVGNGNTRTLTLNAHAVIDVNSAITATSGSLNVVLNAGGAITLDANITTRGGNLTTQGTTFENVGATIDTRGPGALVGGNITLTHTGLVQIGANMLLDEGTANITGVGIQFVGASGLISGRVATLNAGTSDITSGGATSDITVSGAGAAVSLQGTAIGTSSNRLVVNLGAAGTLGLNATSGDIYADLAGGSFSTSRITTLSAGGTGADIDLQVTSGNLTIDNVAFADSVADNTANDDFVLTSTSGNVVLSNSSALVAATVKLSANGTLTATTSGPHLNTSGTGTAITLMAGGTIGTSANRIGVQAGTGLVTATTTSNTATDGVFLASTGRLSLGAIATGTAIQSVNLTTSGTTPDVDISAVNSGNDNWTINSAGAIAFSGLGSLAANSLALTAASAINLGTASLTSTGAANLTATAGNISFGAAGSITAASATLLAGGDILGSSANATDINTSGSNGNITLSADSLGASGQPLQLNPGDGILNLTATTGGVFVQLQAGDLLFSKLSLNVQAANQQIVLSTLNGDIRLDNLGGLVMTADDDWTLTTGGNNRDIAFTASAALFSDALTLSATRNIGSSVNPFLMQPSGPISASAGGNVFLRKATGNLDTGDFTLLESTQSGGIVSIAAANGSVNVDDVAGLSVANDTLRINASGGIAFSTTLTANRVELTAGGNIASATGPGVDIAAVGGISLVAGGIGASGERLKVNPGSAAISAATSGSGAAGSIYLESSAALDLAAFTTDTGTAQTVDLLTTAGDLTVSAITSNDNWILSATGDIVFQGTLTAASVGLNAGGNITSAPGNGVDISAAGGIALVAGGGIGASGQRLIVNPGSSALSASTSGANAAGSIYLQSSSALDLNAFTTAAGSVQTVDLRTTAGDLTISTAINSNDNWILSATGDIVFQATLTAASVSLDADGNITSATGAGVDISAAGGISLTAGGGIGASGERLKVNPGSGAISANTSGDAADGSIYLESSAALNLNAFTTDAASTQTIDLLTTAGDLTISTTINSNDDWFLNSTGNITFGAATLTARHVTLDAGGNITSGTAAVDVIATGNAVTGGVTLIAGGGIGASGERLIVNPGSGALSATTSGVGLDGSIFLESSSGLDLSAFTTVDGSTQTVDLRTTGGNLTISAAIDTDDDWFLDATGNIIFDATGSLKVNSANLTAGGTITSLGSGTDIDTSGVGGDITLSADSLGASGQPLQLNPGAGDLDLTATTGGVFVQLQAGSLLFSRMSLDVQAANQQIVLSTLDGHITLDNLGGLVNTANDDWTLIAGGTDRDITFTSATALTSDALTLSATRNIGSSVNPFLMQPSGAIGAISATAGGDIFLRKASGDLLTSNFAALTSTKAGGGFVSIGTKDGAVNVNSIAAGVDLDDDTLEIVTGGDAGDTHAITLNTTLAAGAVRLTALGAIIGNAGDTTDIVTTSATGITLSGTSIGASGTPLEVNSGAGQLDVTAKTGGVFIEFDGATLQTSLVSLDVAGSGQTIFLSTGSGSIAVDGVDGDPLDGTDGFDVNTRDDHFTLRTGGSNQAIAFSGATTLTGATVTLDSSGAITSGAATDVVSLAGDIILLANGNIGAAGNELLLQSAANMQVSGDANIHVRQATGNLLFGRFTVLTSSADDATVSVGTVSGNVSVDLIQPGVAVGANRLEIAAGGAGNITFGTTLTARHVTLDAGGNITSGPAAVDVVATGTALTGGVTLTAGGGIGASGDPFTVQAGAGQVTATTLGGVPAGNIYLTSSGPLRLGAIATAGGTHDIRLEIVGGGLTIDAASVTTDNWMITAGGNVSFVGSGRIEAHEVRITAAGTVTGSPLDVADIDTSSASGLILLSGTSLGGPLQPLQLDSGGGEIDLRASAGDIFAEIENAGGFQTSKLKLLVSETGRLISLDVSGELVFDDVGGFTSTGDDNFVVRTVDGPYDIHLNNAVPFTAANIELDSSGSIVNHDAAVSSDAPVLTPTGLLRLTAAEDIGAGGQPLVVNPGGQLIVSAGNDIYLRVPGSLATSKFLALTSTAVDGFVSLSSGAVTVDDASGFDLDNDTLEIISTVPVTGDITINSSLSAGSVLLQAAGSIVSSTGGPDVTTTDGGTGGDIVLFASRGIGASGNAIVLNPSAAGDITAETAGINTPGDPTAGDIYLSSSSSFRLSGIVTDLSSTQIVSLETTGGSFTIAEASNTNDHWILKSSAAIAFSGDGTIRAHEVELDATGAITSTSTAPVDIDTSAGGPTGTGGDIKLSGTALGASGDSLVLTPGLGNLEATATTGGIFLEFPQNLSLSQFTKLDLQGTSGTLDLSVTSGDLVLDKSVGDSTKSQTYSLSAAGNITFEDEAANDPPTLTANIINLTAGADILNESTQPDLPPPENPFQSYQPTANLQATTSITLVADNLGQASDPLQVAPGTGNLTLVASGDTWVNVVGGGIDATKLSVQGSQTVGLSTS
ncbi:MAG TPA: hypothetical protein VFB80_03990, partial [Pirellulaceae bacterium]|nr:hypothetical protein [Pirellulaceae bacterium]